MNDGRRRGVWLAAGYKGTCKRACLRHASSGASETRYRDGVARADSQVLHRRECQTVRRNSDDSCDRPRRTAQRDYRSGDMRVERCQRCNLSRSENLGVEC